MFLPGVPWAQWGPPTYLPFTLGLFRFLVCGPTRPRGIQGQVLFSLTPGRARVGEVGGGAGKSQCGASTPSPGSTLPWGP